MSRLFDFAGGAGWVIPNQNRYSPRIVLRCHHHYQKQLPEDIDSLSLNS